MSAAGGPHPAALLTHAPVGIFWAGPDGGVAFVNEAWRALVGMSAADAEGDGWLGTVHPDDRERVRTEWEHAVARSEPFASRFRHVVPDGRVAWVAASAVVVRGGDGRVLGWAGTSADITESVREDAELVARERIATAVAENHDPRIIFTLVAHEASRVLESEAAAVVRLEADAGVLVGAWAAEGLPLAPLGTPFPRAGRSATARALRSGRAERVAYDPTVEGPAYMRGGRYTAGVAAPIRVAGALWGAVSVAAGRPEPFAADAEQRLERFADLVSLAVANADARFHLRTMAASDHLTGLPNARVFHDRLSQEVERALRDGRPLSLVLFDVDHFKGINDTHGHPVGDRVLAEVAMRLGGAVRAGELVARVGGEEFAWIIPGVDGEDAEAAAERARGRVSAAPIAPAGRVTISAGVCSLADASGAGDLYHHADVALYRAKAEGRDATCRYVSELDVLPAGELALRRARATALSGLVLLSEAVDLRDPARLGHSVRVAELAGRLAGASGWSREREASLREAALVHDIGAIALPPPPGAGDPERMPHAELGSLLVAQVLGAEQAEWVLHHHERLDGSGHPGGVGGDALDDGARMLALAEGWDALTGAAPAGGRLSPDEALERLRGEAGTGFCPRAVAALVHLRSEGGLADLT